ncbi:hypothetical protein [Treponema sp.]|uniref:hypothetical protein n=1 Tax=Treponema sp. TaxID=166 RepID=UPI003F059F48
MDNIQKFYSDVQKIKKRCRAENPNAGAKEICAQIEIMFSNANRSLKPLAEAFFSYWMNSRISSSADISSEPTDEHIKILGAMQALIDNDISLTDALSKNDWKELCQITSCEADGIPLETLNSLMSVFLDKQAM